MQKTTLNKLYFICSTLGVVVASRYHVSLDFNLHNGVCKKELKNVCQVLDL